MKKGWALSESEYIEGKILVLKKLKELCKGFECWLVCYVKELKIMFKKTE